MKTKRLFICLGLLWVAPKLFAQALTFPEYQISVESEKKGEKPFLLNKHQTLLVTLKPSSEAKAEVVGLKFDARMPQHKHGMVTQAKVVRLESLKYLVQGVRLHMPGE